ncbi:MAG: KilA-N domain-containing protein [Candidatus Saccharimonadales bacterium]
MTKRVENLEIGDSLIKVLKIHNQDYICLTDMVKNYGGDQAIYSWLRNRNTVEFLGVWETMNNPGFSSEEFDNYRKQAGLNSFNLTPKKWIDSTGAIGIVSKAGRYGGGTFAHKDIAFEFGSYISPEFKLLIIKEFQRLKQREEELVHWDYRRFLSKVNYRLHTDAVKKVLIPLTKTPKNREGILYASEADLINISLFGMTAKEWRNNNKKIPKKMNIRDTATIEQLTVLSNLESLNSMMITDSVDKAQRFKKLREESQRQMSALISSKLRMSPVEDDPKKITE